MKKVFNITGGIGVVLLLMIFMIVPRAQAVIDGVSGTTFNLTARDGFISTPDGGSVYAWGYALNGGVMQYPGPTLILNEGDTITITLTNELPASAGNVSIVFPGHSVQEIGGSAGIAAREALPGGTVTYRIKANNPGTYYYQSGTRPDIQVSMGLVGAMIIRPWTFDPANPTAYNHPDSSYDHEYLFFLTEMDLNIHEAAYKKYACNENVQIDTNSFFPVYWFINGRCAPDTMFPAGAPWLPNQPYNCRPRLRPGEKLLMRMIGAGRDLHPFHHHGNNSLVIARDGRLLESLPGSGPDMAVSEFTLTVPPGGTIDAIFEWTGAGLGWDIYGHEQDIDIAPEGNFPGAEDVDHNGDGIFDSVAMEPNEYASDHGKPFPVVLPDESEMAFGGLYSGSPFLGAAGSLPPGEGGLNMFGGFAYMWHSHNEKEMTNNDIFPGGMMTQCLVEPPGTPIP
ncbi:MAG: multicopper oxidase domain-containing protein [Deltaproteobacteria bacterium]|nr:multicopper oxidase domain-containing protein [Deltaproteobacteria bacterium]MBW2053589.1 multicopper oxidase domain-containing protein [Deltaproteobacteria bacterium]MBW2142202.1 multicopper oxidase domain-containing protein [Deltaproteobacteria bacterium]MBW2324335.1 multicopper oxidase domain-containing protein [Deltaproteobacteria bacterium]